MEHREIPVKVTAWVDEGIASLVSALNEFEEIVTLDSCQGGDEHGAYVLFAYEGEAEAGMEFARGLARRLSHDPARYLLRVEWQDGSTEPLFELACPPDQTDDLAEAISSYRTTPSADGTACRAPRSSRAHPNRRHSAP